MSPVLSKITTFFLLIVLGILLKGKFNGKAEKGALKTYILNVALPATIFISLISINIDTQYFYFPLLAILFNGLIFLASPLILRVAKIHKNPQKNRTLLLLLPSFAPGLSCFPIINEFLGSEALAKASLFDFGNKIFVLLFLFIFAFRLHHLTQKKQKIESEKPYVTILKSLFLEPINILIFVAVMILATGNNINTIPPIFVDLISKIKGTLTPLVLIFIGLSVVFNRKVIVEIIPTLFLRAGLCLLIVTVMLQIFAVTIPNDILFFMILSLSSVSFWPFAHMSLIDKIEQKAKVKERTFDIAFGLNYLAYSLPFSTLLILGLLVKGAYFINFSNLYYVSVALLLIGFGMLLLMPNKENLPDAVLSKKKKWRLIYFFTNLF